MSKLNKLSTKIKENFKIFKEFGMKYAFYNFLESIVCRNSVESKFSQIIHKKSYDIVCKFLINNSISVIQDYKLKCEVNSVILQGCNIYFMWWQGITEMPEQIRVCLNSITINNPNNKVILIDKNNYNQYVDIPPFILQKFKSKRIGIAHFSDFVRIALLKKHGGIWLDSTFLCTKSFDSNMFKLPFYTLKHDLNKDFHICKGKWTVGLMCASKENILISFIYDCLYNYWKNFDIAICYLLLDCFIRIGYENIESLKREIDSVPINNKDTFNLQKEYSNKYNKEYLLKYQDTYIFRLTYKSNYQKKVNGGDTVYKKIVDYYLKGDEVIYGYKK